MAESTTDFLKERADDFFSVAERSFREKRHALSAFSVEQAVQLNLKYFIGSRLGDFPKTHNLLDLLHECTKLCPELREFSERNTTMNSHIKDSYVMTRYYDKQYTEREVREMLNFYAELISKLKECAEQEN